MATRISTKVFKWVHLKLIIFLMLFSDPVIPSSNIVKSLLGFPGPLPFNLETGYIAVDDKKDVEYFYYFFESEGNPRDDPLMLWFIGGPGCFGVSTIAFETGPIRFKLAEYNGSVPTLELNPHSWTKVASIIFIDAPAGSGFSYSSSLEGSQSDDLVLVKQSFNFLKKWLLAHPKFISNPLYLGGDSYGGFIVPMVAEEIAKSVEASDTPTFNFQGYLVGNPVTDFNIDGNSKVPYAHRMTLISDELYESVKKTCNGQYERNDDNNPSCTNDLNAISLCIEKLDVYHILRPKCRSIFTTNGKMKESYWNSLLEMQTERKLAQQSTRCLNLALIHFWANDKAVQRALHIHEGTIKTWFRCPRNLSYTSHTTSVVSYHQRLNSQGYRALVYSGDHDLAITYVGTQAWIKSLNLPIVDQWRPWVVDDQIAGYVTKHSRGLTFATVKGGGHTAPEFQPKECFAMFRRWISKEPL